MSDILLIPIDTRGRAKTIIDPNAVLDYTWDWKEPVNGYLLADDDTIVSINVTGTNITVDSAAHDGRYVTAWLSGAVPGTQAIATAHIVTAAGREDDRSIFFKVKER